MDVEASSKQNILIVHNYYQIPGGEDTVVANEKKMLEEHGHKVVLYSRDNSELKEMSALRKFFLPFAAVFNPRTYKDVKKLIKSENIDIVHVHNTLTLVSPAVYYAALKCGVPLVQTVHNFRLLCPGATFYRDGHICEDCVEHGLRCAVRYGCYRNSRAQTLLCVIITKIHRMTGVYGKINYICLTDFNKEKLFKLKQIKPERVYVKPNFVNEIREFVSEEKRENRYVFAGRLDKLKGIDILLQAWQLMGNSAPKLFVCGTGPMEEWCVDYISKNGLNVEMKGFVANDEVRKLIAKSKAMILPTQWYEGFPMSIVEAFSVGTPVIVSDLGNGGSLVEEGVTGCKFKNSSSQSLVEAIKAFESMNNKNWQSNVLAEYNGKYTAERNYKVLNSLYSKTVKETALEICVGGG